MKAVWDIIVPLASFGIPVIVIGVLAVIIGLFVLMPTVRKSERTTEYEDPDDDPKVIRNARLLRISLFGGGAVAIVGAILFSAPQWATILV